LHQSEEQREARPVQDQRAKLRVIKRLWGVACALLLVVLSPLFTSTSAQAQQGTEGWDLEVTHPPNTGSVSTSFNIAIKYAYPAAKMKPPVPMTVSVTGISGSGTSTRTQAIVRETLQIQSPSGVAGVPVTLTGTPMDQYRIVVRFGPFDDTTIFYWSPLQPAPTLQPTARITPTTPSPSPKPPPSSSLTPKPTLAPAAIYVQSDPGDAEIWLNGVYQTNTNFSATAFGLLDLKPGPPGYTVTLRKQGYLDYTVNVVLAPNEMRDIKAKLQQGTTATGWLKVDSDPTGAQVWLDGNSIGTSPGMFPGIRPGKHEIRLNKSDYDDYTNTVTIEPGNITVVTASLSHSGGIPVLPIAGGVAAVAVIAAIIRGIASSTKSKTTLKAPKQPIAKPTQTNAPPKEKVAYSPIGYKPQTEGPQWAPVKDWRPKEIIDADNQYGATVKAQKTLQKLTSLTSSDPTLTDFVTRATGSDSLFGPDGHINTDKVSKLETTVKTFIKRDQMINQTTEYTVADAAADSARDIQEVAECAPIRIGMALTTLGLSEGVFIPVSAAATSIQLIDAGVEYEKAARAGLEQGFREARFVAAVGMAFEGAPIILKYLGKKYGISLFDSGAKAGAGLSAEGESIGKIKDPALASDLKRFDDLARDSSGFHNRTEFMNKSSVYKAGETPPHVLDPLEREAVNLQQKYGKGLAKVESDLPPRFKDALDTGKQKTYENARNDALTKTIEKMKADGINVEGKSFKLTQTGTHAQPGNRGFNSLKPSDYDATGGFPPEYNTFYETRLGEGLKKYGYGADDAAIKAGAPDFGANVYGHGTSNTGSYSGGALKQVEHMNQATGSEVIAKVNNGKVAISTETPQVIDSLNTKWAAGDFNTAAHNYRQFASDKIMKGGGVENILKDPTRLKAGIKDLSKEVSRMHGQYSASSAEQFRLDNLSRAGGQYKFNPYEPPPAARAADYMKRYDMPIDQAKLKAGFTGSDQELFETFMKLLGI